LGLQVMAIDGSSDHTLRVGIASVEQTSANEYARRTLLIDYYVLLVRCGSWSVHRSVNPR